MERDRFDAMSRAVADGMSRRRVLGGLAMLAGGLLGGRPVQVLAQPYRPPRPGRITCRTDADCADGYYCQLGTRGGTCLVQWWPDVCTAGTGWVVCRADAESAWISTTNPGVYTHHAICQQLGYSGSDAWGGNNSKTCGSFNDQFTTSCENPGTESYNFADACPDENTVCFTIQWRCYR